MVMALRRAWNKLPQLLFRDLPKTGRHQLPVAFGIAAQRAMGTASAAAAGQSSARLESAQAARLTDIGIRPIFNSDHDIFRENARRFFQQEVAPYHAEWEKQGEVSREVWKKAGANGLLCIHCPAELGGVGGDWLSATVAHEEQMYANCSGVGFNLHSELVIPYLVRYGSKGQQNRYIPSMVDGSCIASFAMTEPGAGSDVQGIRTNARRDGDDWILNGNKIYITNGWMADVVLVAALTSRDAKSVAHGLSLFLVDTNSTGFKKGRKLSKIGLHAQDTAELFFDDVRLPKSALLGEVNQGFFQMMNTLQHERLFMASISTASSEFIFEETRDYVKQRKAFGKTLSNLQTIQHKLAEMKTEICVTRAFVDTCLQLHNEGKLDSQMASMAKYWASDVASRVAGTCLRMHGGAGYMAETAMARVFVDSAIYPIVAGPNEIMKELIARQILANR